MYYLYKLTLSNYIKDSAILSDPIFETIFLNFISKNLNIVNDNDLVHTSIIYLHNELDLLFLKSQKSDTKIALDQEFFKPNKPRLKSEIKKFAVNIRDVFLGLIN